MSCCDLYAGMLRDNITILRPSDVADGYGGNTTKWVNALEVMANVKQVNAKKQWGQDRLASVKTYEITTRADCCIESFCRIVYKCTQLTIVGIVEPRHGWIIITAESGAV